MRVIFPSEPPNVVAAVMRLWRVGLDTERIGQTLKEPQHKVERWLHVGLDRAFVARSANPQAPGENV